eukprot:gene14114-18689_t
MRILLVHILPNIMPIMIVQISLTMGYAILNAAGLSFIGLGVRPPTAEWGIMVAEGASFMVSGEWWIALFPGLALMIAVFCFNLLGDGREDGNGAQLSCPGRNAARRAAECCFAEPGPSQIRRLGRSRICAASLRACGAACCSASGTRDGVLLMTSQPLLDVHDLTVEFATRRGIVKAVQH